MTNKVIFEIDETALSNIRATLKDRSHVEIGLFDSRNATIGRIHEFGAIKARIPARSFLRKTVAQRGEKFVEELRSGEDFILDRIVAGEWKSELDTWGKMWVRYIKECFETFGWGQWRPLAKRTVIKKGHDIPLFETGALQDNVRYEVKAK